MPDILGVRARMWDSKGARSRGWDDDSFHWRWVLVRLR